MNRRRFIQTAVASILPTPALAFAHRGGGGPSLLQLQNAYVGNKWGLFLHFNMATFLDVENAPTGVNPNTFNPSALSIDQWVATAVAAKVKYATLTVKHIDGFCLWPTTSTSYCITSASPWYASSGNLDIVGAFVTKFNAAGIEPHFYFSVQDEQVTEFFTQAATKTYLQLQLTELLTNYGPIKAIWIDRAEPAFGGTPYPWDTTNQRRDFIKEIQAQCLIVNNSKTTSYSDTDIIVYELSGNPPPGNTNPSEVVAPMRTDFNWFWKSTSNPIQTASQILTDLATINALDASYMLNAGPDNTGNIPANMVSVLTTVGASL